MEESSLPASDEEATLPAGTKLGKYEIVRLLGAGGMGAVYEAVHTEIGKRVAIKTLAPAVAAIPGARQRFLREAQLTSRLRHPNIVDLSDMGSEGRVAYLVMELLAGEDLSARLERTGALAARDLVDLMLPVCSALIAAHDAGIVHRDLKPHNVFLARGPQGVNPKVLDFGISKSSDTDASSSLTSTGSVIGTPHYLAPEQIKDARTASAASDQYSIGVIFYKCLTGTNPFEGESIFAVLQAIVTQRAVPVDERRPGLPDGLGAVVERAMNPLPWERFGSMRDLAMALLPFASPKARMIWEDTFSGAAPEPAPEARQSHTMPMPTPDPGPARIARGFEASRSRADAFTPRPLSATPRPTGNLSGTLPPSGNLGASGATTAGLGPPPRGRGTIIAAVAGGAALAVGAFAIFTRGGSAPPPSAPVAMPAAAPSAVATAPKETPPAAPAPAEAPKAEAQKAEAPTAEAQKTEASAKAQEIPTATPTPPKSDEAPVKKAAHKHAAAAHQAPAPAAPEAAPARPTNPNGSPVLD